MLGGHQPGPAAIALPPPASVSPSVKTQHPRCLRSAVGEEEEEGLGSAWSCWVCRDPPSPAGTPQPRRLQEAAGSRAPALGTWGQQGGGAARWQQHFASGSGACGARGLLATPAHPGGGEEGQPGVGVGGGG